MQRHEIQKDKLAAARVRVFSYSGSRIILDPFSRGIVFFFSVIRFRFRMAERERERDSRSLQARGRFVLRDFYNGVSIACGGQH